MSDRISVEELRETVRAFAERELAPEAEAIDRDDTFPRWLWPRLGEMGVLGPTVPEEDGGAGLGFLEHLVVVEEISRASASMGMSYAAHSNLCVHNLWANSTREQRERWTENLQVVFPERPSRLWVQCLGVLLVGLAFRGALEDPEALE